jgi:hypothetical protein
MRFAMKWIGSLCLLLTFWAAAAEPIHHHANNVSPATCAVCMAAHASAPSTPSHCSRPTLIRVGIFEADEISSHSRLAESDLGIRGPPAVR